MRKCSCAHGAHGARGAVGAMVLVVLLVLFVLFGLVILMSPSFKHWGSLCRVQDRDPFVIRTCMPPGRFVCMSGSCVWEVVWAWREGEEVGGSRYEV